MPLFAMVWLALRLRLSADSAEWSAIPAIKEGRTSFSKRGLPAVIMILHLAAFTSYECE